MNQSGLYNITVKARTREQAYRKIEEYGKPYTPQEIAERVNWLIGIEDKTFYAERLDDGWEVKVGEDNYWKMRTNMFNVLFSLQIL